MIRKIILLAIITLSTLVPSFGQSAKLVSVTAAAGVPEGADFQIKPMGYKYGITLHFFVSGENMRFFDKESLKADGWELESFPKVQKDGTQASFSVHKKGDYLEKVDDIKVEGSILIATSSEAKTLTQKIKIGDKSIAMGPYKVRVGKASGVFGSEGVHVEGDIIKIKEVKVLQNGKSLKSNGSTWSEDKKTFQFNNLEGEIEVVFSYWNDVEKIEVKFKK